MVTEWQRVLSPRGKDTQQRRRLVRARLREGYTTVELIEAIHGCASSDFHRTNGHTDLTLICRDASHVDRFRALSAASSPQRRPEERRRLTVDEEALQDLEQWVRDHPGDTEEEARLTALRARVEAVGNHG